MSSKCLASNQLMNECESMNGIRHKEYLYKEKRRPRGSMSALDTEPRERQNNDPRLSDLLSFGEAGG